LKDLIRVLAGREQAGREADEAFGRNGIRDTVRYRLSMERERNRERERERERGEGI